VVALHENCPATPVMVVPANVIVVPTRSTETTVVFAGMPEPVTDCPAPISVFTAAKVTLALPFVVDPVSVKTPTCCIVKALMSPISTGVLLSLLIEARFSPGCATSD